MSPFRLTARRTLVAAAAVLVLAGSAVGIAGAQTAPTATPGAAGQARPGYQAFLDALAKRLNISSANLQTAIGQARTDVGLPAGGGFPGGGQGGKGERGFGGDLTAAAQAIGITADQLRTELPGKSLAQVAQAHGKSATDVATALKTAANQRIDQAVTAGRLTAADATTQKQQAATRIDQMVNEVKSQGGPGAPGGRGERGFGGDLTAAAQAIGITADQLRTELPGKSLAQVAQAHGKSATDVAAALKTAANQRIDQAVTAGRLTAADATTQKQQAATRIDQMVNEVRPQGGTRGLEAPGA